ncbi:hypothetical protein D3C78_1101230 [compost metagenome]
MWTCGLSRAFTMRSVICWAGCRWPMWIEAETTSKRDRNGSGKSSSPSARISSSTPRRMRNGASSRFKASISAHCAWALASVRPWVTPRLWEWSVTTRYW